MWITPRSTGFRPVLRARTRKVLSTTFEGDRRLPGLVDETYIKVKKAWMYLYRAVDSQGNTLEFLLSPTRDGAAAKRFLLKTLAASHTSSPRVINVDKNAAYPKAFDELKAEGHLPASCELRQITYLNNLIEQDQRAHQEIDKAGDGLFL